MIRILIITSFLVLSFSFPCYGQSNQDSNFPGVIDDIDAAIVAVASANSADKVVWSYMAHQDPQPWYALLGWDRECVENLEYPGVGRYDVFVNYRWIWAWRNKDLVRNLCPLKDEQNVAEFMFSDGSPPLKFTTNIIEQITADYPNWNLTIDFTDGRSTNLVLRNTTLGLDNNNINLDPNGTAPLSALATFTTPTKGNIRVVVPGKGASGIDIENTFADDDTFQIPILGLYADYTNAVEFYYYDLAGNELSKDVVNIITEPLAGVADVTIVSNNLSSDDNHVYMEVGLKQAFDQNGDVRWVLNDPNLAQVYDRLENGNWLISGTPGTVVYHWPTFHEVDMLGNVVATYQVPNLGHHELRAMSNGNILVGSNSVKMEVNGFNDVGTLQEDTVIEISSTTGTVVKEYDFNLLLDSTRKTATPSGIADDWLHVNSAFYDELDNSIVVSGRFQGVFKLDRATDELVWILAPHQEWPSDLQQYLLTPVDNQGNALDIANINFWPYGQHSAIVLDNGNILMYDNGSDRGSYKPEGVLPENLYTRAVEYKIDEINMTIEKVWEFDYGRNVYTFATGDVDYLVDTNGRLISFLWLSSSALPTPRVVELDDSDNIVFEYTINGGVGGYRSDRFHLYEGIH